jgi:hypothetical protein
MTDEYDVRNPIGEIETLDAAEMHAEILAHLDAGARAGLEFARKVNATIIRLEAGAGSVNAGFVGASHLRLRVRSIVFVAITGGVGTLNIGEASYPFAFGANSTNAVELPLVIERGVNLSYTATDGRAYVVADPE